MFRTLKQLISNPANDRLSTSDTTLVGAFVASTLVLLWVTIHGQLNDWLFAGYLAAWVTQSQASKRAAILRDKGERDATES